MRHRNLIYRLVFSGSLQIGQSFVGLLACMELESIEEIRILQIRVVSEGQVLMNFKVGRQ